MRSWLSSRNSTTDLSGGTPVARATTLLRPAIRAPLRHAPVNSVRCIGPSSRAQALLLASMATAASILAVARAASPQIRSRQDQLVFALHAAVLISGYRLVAVGDSAKLEGLQPDAPDAPLTGWNSSSDAYSFAYVSEDTSPPAAPTATSAPPLKLLVKVVPMGDLLLACMATDTASSEPQTLELPLDDYVSPSSDADSSSGSSSAAGPLVPKTYKNLDQLAQQVNTALADLTAAALSSGPNKKQCTAATATTAGQQQQEAAAARSNPGHQGPQSSEPRPEPQQHPDPDYDPLRIGPPRRPLRVGEDDIMPHLPGGGLGGRGLMPPGLPGGGMHVGPGHPFFADRMRHPDVMPGRGGLGGPLGPGGVRWDPINPEGLEGWRPEDFQRPRPGRGGGGRPDIDPDIGLPGPGRGTDWDSMYG